MTDDLFTPLTAPNPAAPGPRKCRRHEWFATLVNDLGVVTATAIHAGERDYREGHACRRCGALRNPVAVRRGKSSRRLGGDQERRIERVYGPTKIGERGDPVDHLGRLGKWQSKATRNAVPRWLADPMRKMAGLYGDRIPLLILSFVKPGVTPEDYIVIAGRDWLALHGRDSDEEIQPPDPYTEELAR